MKIITLLTCIFVFSINAIALNIGTTNIVFTYEDISITLEQQAIVSNCVDTLLEPALPFHSFSRFQDKVYLEFNIYGYPFNLRMFKNCVVENNTMTLPITKSFSTKILSNEVLRTKYADAISKLPEFCARLKSLNVQQITDHEIYSFVLIPNNEKKNISKNHCIELIAGLKNSIIYDVPIICFKEDNIGPNNDLYLWVYLPNNFQNLIYTCDELIYYNGQWYISSLLYDFSNK